MEIYFDKKELIISNLALLLRNCPILSVVYSSFTSNSFLIRSCPDPDTEWFPPNPDPAESFVSGSITLEISAPLPLIKHD
jgi:hypothetical protein